MADPKAEQAIETVLDMLLPHGSAVLVIVRSCDEDDEYQSTSRGVGDPALFPKMLSDAMHELCIDEEDE